MFYHISSFSIWAVNRLTLSFENKSLVEYKKKLDFQVK